MTRVYLVGGAVRDKYLGLPIKERDWVVVGSSPDQLLAQGYHQVGNDFPVFLHPDTKEEYALARTERKTAPGYKGFVFNTDATVTLEEDLLRRDLTINAMAEDEHGKLIDPYHGLTDLQQKVLRHVSPAFIEDPVRILRVARFHARFTHLGFSIAPETIELMRNMSNQGEVNALVPERVWQEWSRALGETTPTAFLALLKSIDAVSIVFPEIANAYEAVQSQLQQATHNTTNSLYRFAAALSCLTPDQITQLAARCMIPHQWRDLAIAVATKKSELEHVKTANDFYLILKGLDAFRRPQQLHDFIAVLKTLHFAEEKLTLLEKAYRAAQAVKAEPFIQQGFTQRALHDAIVQEQCRQISRQCGLAK